MHPPGSRVALRLRQVEDGIAIGVLEVVGKTEFCLAVDAALVAPARDPRPAGATAAISDMQSLLDHAPVRFSAGREAQTRAARCQSCVADGAGHQRSRSILPTFCLLSVPGRCRMCADTLAENPYRIETS
jgi:hypothetical protein